MQHFCSGSSNLYLNLHRIDPDDTGQSGVLWKGTVSVPGEAYLLLSHTYLFEQHWPQLLLDHIQTMGYLLVSSTYVPLTVILGLLVESVILINHGS